MDLSFNLDPEVYIGAGTLSMCGTICSRYGQRIMLAADHSLNAQTINRLKEILEDSAIEVIVFDGIEEKSSVETAENIVDLSNAGHCSAIIGFGGQKAQTIARAAAIMTPMRISAFDLLEGKIFQKKFLPFISIPTEGLDAFSLTECFLAADPRSRLIKSIQSPHDLCAAVIVDSSLFTFLSKPVYIFDGFLSAVESYCSAKANFFSDALLERALSFYAKLLKSAGGINADIYAQAGFLASLGTSACSPGAGTVLASAVSARFPVSKQQCSAALLPLIAEKLVGARPEKMARAASFLGQGKGASVAEAASSAVNGIIRCMEALGVQPNLKNFNIPFDRLAAAIDAARNLEYSANSSWTVSEQELFGIFKKIL